MQTVTTARDLALPPGGCRPDIARQSGDPLTSAQGDQLSERNGLSAVMNRLQRRRLGRLRPVYGLDAIENLAEIALRDLNVIVVLQIEPKLCRCAERLGEPKR